ncbi:hypothetical protein RvY_04858 [Ramazzottius varieornatus]|uniref:Uncharacterized protein n=1 Tax=Ramazzottius varieornatus TaxID=947166 RepID=A0A1D1UT19_RAMVA|nr:hypothetical protein RvY_04858 [Ramazzottius varieornatus]
MKILLITFLSGVRLASATNDASSNTHDVQNSSSVPPHPPVNPGAHGLTVNPAKDDVAVTPLPRTMKENQEHGFSTVVAKQRRRRDVVTITPGPTHDIHHEPGQDVDQVTSPSHATALPQVIETGRQNGPRIARQTNHTETEAVGRKPYSHGVEHHTISGGAEITDPKQMKDHTLRPNHPLAKDDVYTTPKQHNITRRAMMRRRRDVTMKESPQYKESDKTVEGVTQVPKTKRDVRDTNVDTSPVEGNVGSVTSGSALQDLKGNPIVMQGSLLKDESQLHLLTTQLPASDATTSNPDTASTLPARRKRDATTQATGPVEGNIGSVASGSAVQDIKGSPIVMQGSLLRDESQLRVLATSPPTSGDVASASSDSTPPFSATDIAIVQNNIVTVEPADATSTVAARRRRDVDATTPSTGPVEGNVGSVASGSALQDIKGNPIVMQGSLLKDESQLRILTTPQPSSGDASANTGRTQPSEPMSGSVQPGDGPLPGSDTAATAAPTRTDTTQVVTVNVPVEVHVAAATVAPARRRRDIHVTTPVSGPVVGNIGSVSSGSALLDVKGNPIVMQGGLLKDESQLHVLTTQQSGDAAGTATVAVTRASAESMAISVQPADVTISAGTTQTSDAPMSASVQPGNAQLPPVASAATSAPNGLDTTRTVTVNVPVEVHVSAQTIAPARRRRSPDADGTTQATGPVEGNVGSVASGSTLQDVKGNPIVMQGSLLRDESQLHVLTATQPSVAQGAADAGASATPSTQVSAEPMTASVQPGEGKFSAADTSATAAPSVSDTTSVVTINVPVEVHVSAATVAPARRRRNPDETRNAPANVTSVPFLTAAFEAPSSSEGSVPQGAQPAVVVDTAHGAEIVRSKRDTNSTSNPSTGIVAAMDGTAASLYRKDDHATKDDPAKTHNVDEAVKSDSSAQSDTTIHPVSADASKLTGDHTIPLVNGTSSQHLIA